MPDNIRFAASQGSNYFAEKLSYKLDRRLNKPSQVTLYITDACASRCIMCDLWKREPEGELTADEWKVVLDRLREWLGPFFLMITGGEPFQKPGFHDILAHCRAIGIKTKVSSNGMYLTPKACSRVLEVGPDFLSLSVDHWRPEVHDQIRGVPLHERCVAAYEYFLARDDRPVLGISTIIMEETYRDLVRTAKWAVDMGVDRVLFQALYPTFGGTEGSDPAWFERNPHWPRDPDELHGIIEELRRLKSQGLPIWNPDEQLVAMQYYFRDPNSHPRPPECMVRYSTLYLDPKGDVIFCFTVNDKAGNALREHPREIWESARAQEIRDKMKYCQAPCLLNCSRGRSLAEQLRLFWLLVRRRAF